jgi:ketosteroid isomerase-like protein
MNHLRWKMLAVCLAMSGLRAAAAGEPGLASTECEVWERERTFAESVARHDRAAFAEHLHDNAVFGAASPNTQRGRETILKAWNDIIEGKGVSLEWRPQHVSVGTDQNIAMSRGPFVITTWDDKGNRKIAIGSFVSVWMRKDKASPWQVAFDGGGPPPTAATADEAKKHLDSAPTVCAGPG